MRKTITLTTPMITATAACIVLMIFICIIGSMTQSKLYSTTSKIIIMKLLEERGVSNIVLDDTTCQDVSAPLLYRAFKAEFKGVYKGIDTYGYIEIRYSDKFKDRYVIDYYTLESTISINGVMMKNNM